LQTDLKKIFLVLIISSIVGLIFNNFNPAGISLIREMKILSFAPDSLIIPEINLDGKETADTVEITTHLENIENEQKLPDELRDTIKQEETELINNENEIINNDEDEDLEEEIFNEPKAINLEQAFTLFNNGAMFIDARDDFDYNEGHISKAINIPFYAFEENENKLNNIYKDKVIVTYCSGTDCDLSVLLGNTLAEMGYNKVFVFFGGWLDWVEANYPTNTL
jgi:rhodanese-related sulfurtransferase